MCLTNEHHVEIARDCESEKELHVERARESSTWRLRDIASERLRERDCVGIIHNDVEKATGRTRHLVEYLSHYCAAWAELEHEEERVRSLRNAKRNYCNDRCDGWGSSHGECGGTSSGGAVCLPCVWSASCSHSRRFVYARDRPCPTYYPIALRICLNCCSK